MATITTLVGPTPQVIWTFISTFKTLPNRYWYLLQVVDKIKDQIDGSKFFMNVEIDVEH